MTRVCLVGNRGSPPLSWAGWNLTKADDCQVLVVITLQGSATDVGFLNASRWLPYLLLGLVVGALVDRRRRQPILVVTDLGLYGLAIGVENANEMVAARL